MFVWANFAEIFLRGMRDRSMPSGTELAREIQLSDWSTAAEQGKLFFCGLDQATTGAIYFTFHNGKNRLSNVRIKHQFKFKISVKKKRRKEIRFDKQKF